MAYRHTLTEEDKRELLRIARATLDQFTRVGRVGPGDTRRDRLLADAGAFVTLRDGDTLRGCIGTQVEDGPLHETVREMAVAAASRDPRFAPVTADQLARLTIEISVLGDRQRVSGPGDVEIGRHGVAIEYRGHRGLLLPQVAPENDWDSETFLARLCAKAGLPDDAWRSPEARVERFTAQHFDEDEFPPGG